MLDTVLKYFCFVVICTETLNYNSNSSRVGQVQRIENLALGHHFLVHLQLVKDRKKQRNSASLNVIDVFYAEAISEHCYEKIVSLLSGHKFSIQWYFSLCHFSNFLVIQRCSNCK